MSERTPLPSSVTQSYKTEALPVAATQKKEPNPKYERQRRYARTEKGKKAKSEVAKRWYRKNRNPNALPMSEAIRLSWQRRKQQQS